MKNWTMAGLFLVMSAGAGAADSCWDHNGSLMRLKAQGAERYFYYEDPRPALRSAGVRRGTLLFNGTTNGGRYSGLARVFSSACPGEPLEYWVEGPVAANQTTVRMIGTRETSEKCQSTGRVVTDELVFTYSHQC